MQRGHNYREDADIKWRDIINQVMREEDEFFLGFVLGSATPIIIHVVGHI